MKTMRLYCSSDEIWDGNAFPTHPEVFSSRELFGSPFKPPIYAEAMNISESRVDGLKSVGPTELRISNETRSSLGDEWEVDEDGYIVEAVDTFRFKISAEELELAIRERRGVTALQSSGEGGEELDNDDTFILGEDMISLLENLEAEEAQPKRPIYRIEMEEDELARMIQRKGDRGMAYTSSSSSSSSSSRENHGDADEASGLGDDSDFRGTIGATEGSLIRFRKGLESSTCPQVPLSVSMTSDATERRPSLLRSWSLAGVSRSQTTADLVGMMAIGLALACTVRVYDLLSAFIVSRFRWAATRLSQCLTPRFQSTLLR